MKRLAWVLVVFAIVLTRESGIAAELGVATPVQEKDRCAVCGMLVAKYPEWVTQLHLSDGRVVLFDGVKDMFVFFFAPEQYGAADATIDAVLVRDYYSQEWIDGKIAYYVTGSDVLGPMGHEFVPFLKKEAAENFLQDHHGKHIWTFEQVENSTVQNMRKGHKMKMKGSH